MAWEALRPNFLIVARFSCEATFDRLHQKKVKQPDHLVLTAPKKAKLAWPRGKQSAALPAMPAPQAGPSTKPSDHPPIKYLSPSCSQSPDPVTRVKSDPIQT